MAAADDLTEFLRVTDVVRIVTTTRDGRTIATPIWAGTRARSLPSL